MKPWLIYTLLSLIFATLIGYEEYAWRSQANKTNMQLATATAENQKLMKELQDTHVKLDTTRQHLAIVENARNTCEQELQFVKINEAKSEGELAQATANIITLRNKIIVLQKQLAERPSTPTPQPTPTP